MLGSWGSWAVGSAPVTVWAVGLVGDNVENHVEQITECHHVNG